MHCSKTIEKHAIAVCKVNIELPNQEKWSGYHTKMQSSKYFVEKSCRIHINVFTNFHDVSNSLTLCLCKVIKHLLKIHRNHLKINMWNPRIRFCIIFKLHVAGFFRVLHNLWGQKIWLISSYLIKMEVDIM